MRGSGDHQRIGCCAEYQGNTPRSYAASSRAGLEVAARSQQSRRLAQRLVQRRKPVRIGVLAEPDEPAQRLQLLVRRPVVGHVLVDGGSVMVDAARLARRESRMAAAKRSSVM